VIDESVVPPQKPSPKEVAKLGLYLGCTAFGGPAAHIALLRREVVEKRKWIDDPQFTIYLGATNIIPGPNSTEMVLLVGHNRAGRRGMLAAGITFIAPAALITLFFAILYDRHGTRAGAEWLLYGVKPVIIVVILHALFGMAKSTLTKATAAIVAVGAMVAYLLGVGEILLLVAGGLIFVAAQDVERRRTRLRSAPLSMLPLKLGAFGLAVAASAAVPYSAARLFWTFLKIGAVLYGSGYVLIAFLRSEFVVDLGWITEQQLLDAVAFGQVTPGPLFSTATFIGYLVGGLSGAVIATVAIFLPAFVFVIAVNRLMGFVYGHRRLLLALTGVTAASIGLMAGVTLQLGQDALVDPQTVLIALVAVYLLFRRNVGTTWLIAGGAVAGVLTHTLSAAI
jgi:chromate transporter